MYLATHPELVVSYMCLELLVDAFVVYQVRESGILAHLRHVGFELEKRFEYYDSPPVDVVEDGVYDEQIKRHLVYGISWSRVGQNMMFQHRKSAL
jgi:hypothetical protein